MPDCVLVADRGVAALRVVRALQRHGVKAVSVHTTADAGAPHATTADDSVLLGDDPRAYGDPRALVEAARQAGADGVHPGAATPPGLEEAVAEAGLGWWGGPLVVQVACTGGPDVVEAEVTGEETTFEVLPPRAVEVVTGLDLTCAALAGKAEGVGREGVALSLAVTADRLAPVTAVRVPEGEDVWVDAAVAEGSTPVDPLLAVLTVWGPDRPAAWDRAAAAWDSLVIEGPVVRRPAALGGKTA